MSYTSQQVLKYIKKIHKKGFSIDHTVQQHAKWELENIPVGNLKIASEDDPYNRVLELNQDHVDSITKQDILAHAIVADENGHIIDGNHRAAKAQALGMNVMPAFVPVVDPDNETYDQHMKRIKTNETTEPSEYVYHASFLPDEQQGLKSVLLQGLRPSETGYAGPGVYFAYDPEGGYYHVSKEEATLFRVKWADLVNKFGTYPSNPNGIERDDDEIIVPGTVPASMLEVEYFPDEWWDLKSAYQASKGPVNEAVIDNVKGAGAVPNNQDVDYFGLRVKMKPSTFLKLAAPLGREHSAELEQYIANGGAIGAPFLDIAVPPEWDDNDFTKSAQIKGHEGRNRMTAILKLEGDKPIETHLFVKYYRNRDLTPPFVEKLNSGLYAEKSTHLIGGPLFSTGVSESLTEDDIKVDHKAKARAWIEKVYAKYPGTWQNNHVMTWGEGDDQQLAMFELIPSMSKKDAVEVKWFQAYPLRQGVGSRAMLELQAMAREDGIALTLFPWQHGQVSQAKLTKFYKGQGFKPTVKGAKNMMWTPESQVGEVVNELFDPKQAGELKWHFGGTQAVTDLDPKTHLVVNFLGHSNPYGIEFHVNHEFDITGGGNVAAIFATVIKAVREFIQHKSDCYSLYFTAKEQSRAKMYDTLAKRVAKQLGWHVVPYDDMIADEKYDYAKESGNFVFAIEKGAAPENRQDAQKPQHSEFMTVFYVYTVEFPKLPVIKIKAKTGRDAEDWVIQNIPEYKDVDLMGMFANKTVPKGKTIIDKGTVNANESIISEGGWASTATQNTVITPHVIEEAIGILNQFAEEFNAWQAEQGLDVEIRMGKPVGSGTYYQRDLKQDPSREYGDVDVVCYIHSREGVGAAKRTSEYAEAVKQFTQNNPKYSTANGANVIMDTSAGPIQVDLIFTYNEHANWARALAPEYRVKGVISASLLSSLAEVLNMSFGIQGVQVKTRDGRPVSFRQSKDTELHTVSTDPEMWAQDMFSYYYQLQNGHAPESIPANLTQHSGLKDEQRLSDIVMAFKALATDLEANQLLGTGALDYIADKTDMMKKIAQVYSKKLDAVINSSKFDKAETPAAVEKANKTKLMVAKYRNEIARLLLN
ncbi:hypothetical protein UFOVP71_345 [uncultured Caudovirales phage]|uniref:ParB/Sulfiredoxin n=1 Tax=uncultured Caudovirales phage TaxID=2100421 RepID=A0A6J5TD12_9CAUD|nr:hypothetical protein UFOVP71_345 [uncultured Caudovirales phage]